MKYNNDQDTPVYEEDEIDLLELLGVLLRHKKKIIVITLAGALSAVIFSVVSLLMPPDKSYLPNLYSSTARLLINSETQSSMIPSGVSSLASMAGIKVGGGSSYGLLAVELSKSNPILDIIAEEFDVIGRYDIKKYPVASSREEIRERLSANLDEDTGVLTVSYLDWDPEFSMKVVNRIVELLDDRFASIGINRNLNQKQLLEQKLVTVNADIAKLEAEIKAFQQKYGILNVQQLAEVQVGGLAELKSQLILKELEIKTYTKFSRIDDPVVNRMKSERDNLESLISQMEKGHNKEGFYKSGPSMSELPDLALEFSHMQRELLVQTEIYKLLTQEYEMAKLKVEGEGPIFQVLELGQASDKKSKPSRGVICIGTTFCAFFISVVLVFLLNMVANIKKDPEWMNKLR